MSKCLVQHLNLANTCLNDDSGQVIFEVLSQNENVLILNLNKNNFTDKVASNVSNLLRKVFSGWLESISEWVLPQL